MIGNLLVTNISAIQAWCLAVIQQNWVPCSTLQTTIKRRERLRPAHATRALNIRKALEMARQVEQVEQWYYSYKQFMCSRSPPSAVIGGLRIFSRVVAPATGACLPTSSDLDGLLVETYVIKYGVSLLSEVEDRSGSLRPYWNLWLSCPYVHAFEHRWCLMCLQPVFANEVGQLPF